MSNGEKFSTYSPNDPNLIEKLSNKGVSISASPLEEKMPSLLGVLLSWFPMLLLIAVWIFFMRQMQGGKGGAMGFGRSKAKLMNELKGKVTFNDVAGLEGAKEEVQEIVDFLKNPTKYTKLGGKIPKGALVVTLIDVESGQVVWLGEAVANIQENVTDEVVRERLDYTIRAMFKLLP